MKQNRNRIMWLAVLLLTTGCTKEAELQVGGAVYSDVPILAASELAQDNVVVVPQSGTRAAADPTKEMTFYLVRADETGRGTGVFGAYATTPLTATRAAGTGVQELTFATPQYYFASNAKTRLTGWYPAATSLTGSVVSWTIDGSTDILTAPEKAGNLSNVMPNLVFNHSLAQVQIHVYAPDANARDTWGTISKIELMEQENTCTYNFSADAATGAVTPKSGTTAAFTVGNIANATIPVATATQVGDPVMIAPRTAAAVLKLAVTTSKLGKVEVSMPAGVYEKNKAYILKLKFNAFTIDATASIGAWQTVDRSEQEVRPPAELPVLNVTVGDVVKGGIVFWVNPEKTHYKIVYAEPLKKGGTWSAKLTYTVGCIDQNDGRVNVAMMEAYSRDHVADANDATKTTGVFATDFPMASWCKALSTAETPAGQWYMPARNEMLEIVLKRSKLASSGFNWGDGWTITSSEGEIQSTHVYLYEGGGNNNVNLSYDSGKGLLDNTRCIAYF